MNVAVLYRKPQDMDQGFPQDSQGRSDLKHITRVRDALEALGHSPHLLDLNLDTYEYIRKANFDLVFNLCDDGFRNNSLLEAHIPAMLDFLRVPYTGSGFFTLATCVNKARTKEILVFHGIPTPEFQVFYKTKEELNEDLKFPLIVKPLHEDASIGLRKESVVSNRAELKERVDLVISNYSQPALVEKYIAGREIYVGILGRGVNLMVLPISEIVFDSNLAQTAKICSYEAKWAPESQQYQSSPVECPAKIDKTLRHRLIEIAKTAYNLLGGEDYGRVDFRIDQSNQPYVLEINPNPDISEDAGLAKMFRAKGLDYDELIEKIINLVSGSREHA